MELIGANSYKIMQFLSDRIILEMHQNKEMPTTLQGIHYLKK